AAKRQAEEASRSKTVFLANISHELRTPLNAIIGFSEVIRNKIFGNDVARYAIYAGYIPESAEHLLSVIRSLLDLSKIEAGRFELQETDFRLETAVQQSVRIVKPQAEARGIELKVSPPDSAVRLHADGTGIKQIIINLLSNAIKFTPKGGEV